MSLATSSSSWSTHALLDAFTQIQLCVVKTDRYYTPLNNNGAYKRSPLRKPSKSLNPDARWYENDHEDLSKIFRLVGNNFDADEQIGRLFNSARNAAGHIPCMDFPEDPTNRYRVNNRSPYRERCHMPSCSHRLARASIIRWIATLVEQEVIDGDSLAAGMRS